MNDVKPWWSSRTIWAAVITVLAVAAQITGRTVSGDDQTLAVDAVTSIVAAVSSLASIYFRLTATAKVG